MLVGLGLDIESKKFAKTDENFQKSTTRTFNLKILWPGQKEFMTFNKFSLYKNVCQVYLDLANI